MPGWPLRILLFSCFILSLLIVTMISRMEASLFQVTNKEMFNEEDAIEDHQPFLSPDVKMPTNRTVVFIETSKGEKCFDYRQSCAVESMAKHNPHMNIIVFLRASQIPANCSTLRQFTKSNATIFNNVKVIHYDLEGVFKDTPLYEWGRHVENGSIHSKHMASHLSDALRLVFVYKYNAIYMDLDFITLRPLNELFNWGNFLVKEDTIHLSNGLFGFIKSHEFIRESMIEFASSYDPSKWAYNGPRLFERLLNRWKCDWTHSSICQNIHFIKPIHVYPFHYFRWKQMFDQNSTHLMKRITNNKQIFTLHLWNFLSINHPSPVSIQNVVNICAAQNCPRTFNFARNSENGSF